MSNPRILEKHQWQDLLGYKPWEVAKELLLPLPWFAMALWASSNQYYALTVSVSAFFFLASLRVSHNAFHYCLGVSRKMNGFIMLMLSLLMMTSMRAHQFTHMQHHRHCFTESDIEGQVANQGFWEMLLNAPFLTFKIHAHALSKAKKSQKAWLKFELTLIVIWVAVIWFFLDVDALKIHSILMFLFHAISPFFTIWSVHHDCDSSEAGNDYDSRTSRSKLLNLLVFNMFFHMEHHVYPAVPTCHLPELARRLDNAGLHNYKTIF